MITRSSKELLGIKQTIQKQYWRYIISIQNYITELCSSAIKHRLCDTFNRPKTICPYAKGDYAFTAVNARMDQAGINQNKEYQHRSWYPESVTGLLPWSCFSEERTWHPKLRLRSKAPFYKTFFAIFTMLCPTSSRK